tara:strand:+ start:417 stop:1253 length:837 start_codon:yes stop_codon:yes gene_type:complete
MFKENIPNQFLMEGISEQHIIGLAAGLAQKGFIPYVNTIASFLLRRAFEQIVIDLCMQNLPVRLIGNGGGLVYAPLGPTHQILEDFSILNSLPNISIIACCDSNEMKKMIKITEKLPGPIYFRLGKGGEKIITNSRNEDIKFGKCLTFNKPKDILIVTTGITTQLGLEVMQNLNKNQNKIALLHCSTIKPFDYKTLKKYTKDAKIVISIEEHSIIGGLSSICNNFLIKQDKVPKVINFSVRDLFYSKYGNQKSAWDYFGLNAKNIENKIKKEMRKLYG